MEKEKTIFHIDVNSAFLSWEAVYRLRLSGGERDLREIPSAVGGDVTKRHGIILAKSIPAKKYGVKTGETLWQARQKCPELVIVPPDYSLYEQCSRAMMELLRQYSPSVEQYSIDEAFVDMTGMELLFGKPLEAANRIRTQIREELGFTVNIGISSRKLLAKMASDFQKPDRVHTLYPEEISQKMWRLPVSELFFVGRATTEKLFRLGIRTIGQLAAADPQLLCLQLGKYGEVIWAFANGLDCSSVDPQPVPNKGYGNSTTIRFDVTDAKTARQVLLALAETVGARLRADHVRIRCVSVSIKDDQLHSISHQGILSNPTCITEEIYRMACQLFEEAWDGKPIRHLGIHTSKIEEGEAVRQLELFDRTDYEKLERANAAVDAIRRRYGKDAVMRASFVSQKQVKPLSGGVQSEGGGVQSESGGVQSESGGIQ